MTSKWLRELGATRHWASATDNVLVLGKWHEGFYPIEWRRTEYKEHKASEEWRVFGIPTAAPLDREDCERILGAIAKGKA